MPNTVQCPSGHYFDLSRFQFCPFCGAPAVRQQQPEQTAYNQPPMPPQPEQVTYNQPPMPLQPEQMAYNQPPMPQPEQVTYNQPPMPQPEQMAYNQPPMPPMPPMPPAPPVPPVVGGEKNTAPTVGWLVGLEGPCAGKSYSLREQRNFIGRSPAMDIVLSEDDQTAEDRHAIITYVPKSRKFYAQPGASRQLYEVNGEAVIDTKVLSADDRLAIGASVFRFVPLCGEAFGWNTVPKA